MYPSEELQSFFSLLSESILKYTRLETVLQKEKVISEEKKRQFEAAISRLKKYEPIQYILGSTQFYGLTLKVNRDTLIPRPETEELVAWILEDAASDKTNPVHSLLDIGTGSGCIAIALAKNLKASSVTAIDVSSSALRIAQENAISHSVAISFECLNILETESLAQRYDVIVSNPPYVRELEKEMMNSNVLDFEPEKALFVTDADPLIFYRHIALLALQHLTSHGKLYFEINEYLSEALKELLHSLGFIEVIVKKDIFGRDRMIRCTLTPTAT